MAFRLKTLRMRSPRKICLVKRKEEKQTERRNNLGSIKGSPLARGRVTPRKLVPRRELYADGAPETLGGSATDCQ